MKYARHTGPCIDPRAAAMAEMYNADPRATYRSIAEHFGNLTASRVGQLLIGLVQQRRGKGEDRVVGEAPAIQPQLFRSERELVAQRAAAKAKLDRDPDVLRCREERAKRTMSLAARPDIKAARAEFKAALLRTGKPGRPRKTA